MEFLKAKSSAKHAKILKSTIVPRLSTFLKVANGFWRILGFLLKQIHIWELKSYYTVPRQSISLCLSMKSWNKSSIVKISSVSKSDHSGWLLWCFWCEYKFLLGHMLLYPQPFSFFRFPQLFLKNFPSQSWAYYTNTLNENIKIACWFWSSLGVFLQYVVLKLIFSIAEPQYTRHDRGRGRKSAP